VKYIVDPSLFGTHLAHLTSRYLSTKSLITRAWTLETGSTEFLPEITPPAKVNKPAKTNNRFIH